MAKKQERIQPVALHAELDDRGCVRVILPEMVCQNLALMLWLHHRVVDLLADRGLLDFLTHDVEERLALLAPDIISDYVAALLAKGEEAVQPPEDEAEETVDGEGEGPEGEGNKAKGKRQEPGGKRQEPGGKR